MGSENDFTEVKYNRRSNQEAECDKAYYLKKHDTGDINTLLFTNGTRQYLVAEDNFKSNHVDLEAGTPYILSGISRGDDKLHDTMKTYWAKRYDLPPEKDSFKPLEPLHLHITKLEFSRDKYEFQLDPSYGFGSTSIIIPSGVIPDKIKNGPWKDGWLSVKLGFGYKAGRTPSSPTSKKVYPRIIQSSVEFLDIHGKLLPATDSDYAYSDSDMLTLAAKFDVHAIWGGREIKTANNKFLHLNDQMLAGKKSEMQREPTFHEYVKELKAAACYNQDGEANDERLSLYNKRFGSTREDSSKSRTKILMFPDLHPGFTTAMAESLAKQAVDTKHYVVWICTPAHQATKPENASILNSSLLSPNLTSEAVLLQPELKRTHRNRSGHFINTHSVTLIAHRIEPTLAKVEASLNIPFGTLQMNDQGLPGPSVGSGYDTDLGDRYVIHMSATPYFLRKYDVLQHIEAFGGYRKVRLESSRTNRHSRYVVHFGSSQNADDFLKYCSLREGLYAVKESDLATPKCVIRAGRGEADPDKFAKILAAFLSLTNDKIYLLSNLSALVVVPPAMDVPAALKGLNKALKKDCFLSVMTDRVHDLVQRKIWNEKPPTNLKFSRTPFVRPGHFHQFRITKGPADASNEKLLKIQKLIQSQTVGRTDMDGTSVAIFAFEQHPDVLTFTQGDLTLELEAFSPETKVTLIKADIEFIQVFPELDHEVFSELPADLEDIIKIAKAAIFPDINGQAPKSDAGSISGMSSPEGSPPPSPKRTPPPSPSSPKHAPGKVASPRTSPGRLPVQRDSSPIATSPAPEGRQPTAEDVEGWEDDKIKDGLKSANISFDNKQSPQARKKVFQLYLKNLKRTPPKEPERGSLARSNPAYNTDEVKSWPPQRLRQELTDAGLEFDPKANNKVLSKTLCDFFSKQDKTSKRNRSSPGEASPTKKQVGDKSKN